MEMDDVEFQETITSQKAYDMAFRVLLHIEFVIPNREGDNDFSMIEIVMPNMRGQYVSCKANNIYELVEIAVKKLQRNNYRLREFDLTEENISRIVKALKNILDALGKLYLTKAR